MSRLTQELEACGHEVTLAAVPPKGELGRFDVVHAVNLNRSVLTQTEAFMRASKEAGVRFVVTPIWWTQKAFAGGLPARDRLAHHMKGFPPLRAIYDRRLTSLRTVRSRQQRVLSAANVICPSGPSEGLALSVEFGRLPIAPIQLGTDVVPQPTQLDRIGVMCAARLDPHKNQLGLIRALRGTGLTLSLAGSDRTFPAYADLCRKAADSHVKFLGHLSSDELVQAYRRSRVHALVSYFELPGLTALDAAVAGAAVVVTNQGSAADYFGPEASYCGTDIPSIRQAVLSAYEVGAPSKLAKRLATQYTWRATVQQYLKAYDGK